MAKDISFGNNVISQGAFKDLSKEAAAVISYKNTAPAEPLGVTGFDAGVEFTAASIKSDSSYWQAAFGNSAPAYLYLPKVRVRKGLPWGIDIGAMYAYYPDSNVKVYGFELSKALLDGSMATPAFGVRATYSKLAGVGDLDLQTAGIDATISKGFLILTPYCGGGVLGVDSRATGALHQFSQVSEERFWQPRVFAGLKVSPLPLFGITAEAEWEVRPVYSLKAAFSF
jgi:hypothetical protein